MINKIGRGIGAFSQNVAPLLTLLLLSVFLAAPGLFGGARGGAGGDELVTLGVTHFSGLALTGGEILLDADDDTSITADTDDQIDIKIAGADDFVFTANLFESQTGSVIDLNGTKLELDADADTSITADTDDQIDIEIAGADDFQFTANTFTVTAGSGVRHSTGTNEGIVFVLDNTLVFTDTSAKTMGVIPADANIVDVVLIVDTAFDDSTTDVIDCGINGGDIDAYVDNIDVSSTGVNRLGDAAAMPFGTAHGDVGGSDITVDCIYTGGTADPSAGAATLYLWWAID